MDWNQRQQESAPEHRDYAGELADAAEVLVATALALLKGKDCDYPHEVIDKVKDAVFAYRNQPQVTHTCRECSWREREINQLLDWMRLITVCVPPIEPTSLAKKAIDEFNEGREAKP